MNRTAVTCTSIASLAIVTAGAMISARVVAGPLDPPVGTVGSTYKTLTEVEPRHAINALNTPGDSDSLFKITLSGSYYLTGNLTGVSGKRGIEIATNDVTIDLNGFSLKGVTGALDGISCTLANATGLAVVNGSVHDWPLDGIDLSTGLIFGGRVEGVVAESNAGDGIRVGNQFAVTRCASINNGRYGIATASTCTITNCSARGNAATGFVCTLACAFSECAAYLNGDQGFDSIFNGVVLRNCASDSNIGDGFSFTLGSTMTGCSATSNDGSGFAIGGRCTIAGCTAFANAMGGGGANIRLTGGDNHVQGNNCTGGLRGIQATTPGNFISRNVCSGNTTNWDLVAGNFCLVVSANSAGAISGNSGGSAPGSTDPNANFTY